VPDDPTLHLIAELDANCTVMGAYYCGECLQCRASAELRRLIGYQAGYAGLIEDNSTYEDELDRLKELIEPIVKAFTVPGNFPGYHDYVKKGLQKEWATLYKSIDKLVKEYDA
jgi:hypothetical protein